MSFWCHGLNQNRNKNIVRISALNFFIISIVRKPKRSHKEDIKKSGQKSLKYIIVILVQTLTPKRHFEINWPLCFKDLLKNYPEVQPVEEENYEKLSVMFQKGELKVSPVQMQSVELMLKNYLEAYKRLACLK